jgi:outer membrane lipoprotein-sorting protein
MNNKTIFKAFGLIICFGTFLAAQDLSLQEVIKKNGDALGGAEAINGIQTLKITATISVDAPDEKMSGQISMSSKRPNMYRVENLFAGMQMIMGNDGMNAWLIDPSEGSLRPKKVDDSGPSGASIFTSARISDLIGSLSGYALNGSALELLGIETLDGSNAWKVKVTPPTGVPMTYYLDAATFLPFKRTMGRRSEILFSDYREVGGVMFAHKIDVKTIIHVELVKIEINVPMDNTLFIMPNEDASPVKN